jgi:hypothetical protein
MSRRRSIKSIASGLAGSFISRNNDVDGYWGIGMLCLLCRQNSLETISISLLGEETEPLASDELVRGIKDHYSEKLSQMLSKAKIEPSWVRSATVSLVFGTSGELPEPPLSTWGGAFLCTVEIMDDLGQSRTASLAGRCGPHDAKRESRSARAVGF